jgi:hypothetical protein
MQDSLIATGEGMLQQTPAERHRGRNAVVLGA